MRVLPDQDKENDEKKLSHAARQLAVGHIDYWIKCLMNFVRLRHCYFIPYNTSEERPISSKRM
jgi:hypothetical protein